MIQSRLLKVTTNFFKSLKVIEMVYSYFYKRLKSKMYYTLKTFGFIFNTIVYHFESNNK